MANMNKSISDMNYVDVTWVGHKGAHHLTSLEELRHAAVLSAPLHCAAADAALRFTMRRKLKLFERMFSLVRPHTYNNTDQEPRRVPHCVEMLGKRQVKADFVEGQNQSDRNGC